MATIQLIPNIRFLTTCSTLSAAQLSTGISVPATILPVFPSTACWAKTCTTGRHNIAQVTIVHSRRETFLDIVRLACCELIGNTHTLVPTQRNVDTPVQIKVEITPPFSYFIPTMTDVFILFLLLSLFTIRSVRLSILPRLHRWLLQWSFV